MRPSESVWDYPRPPAVEPTTARVRVELAGVTVADSTSGFRVLETSHPPVYYLPLQDIDVTVLQPSNRQTYCEFKGAAHYYDVVVEDRVVRAAAWFYPAPSDGYEQIKDYVAFYPGKMDACWVDDDKVEPQPGSFYGGWITPEIAGPFKRG
jgi:uncharacterized protein (DUF427 family)